MREWTRRAQRKAERRATKPARIKAWKARVTELRENGQFAQFRNWNIIQMWTREGFTDAEMSDILGLPIDEIRFEMEIARQNAR